LLKESILDVTGPIDTWRAGLHPPHPILHDEYSGTALAGSEGRKADVHVQNFGLGEPDPPQQVELVHDAGVGCPPSRRRRTHGPGRTRPSARSGTRRTGTRDPKPTRPLHTGNGCDRPRSASQVSGRAHQEKFRNEQIKCANYAYEHGVHQPEATNWKWPKRGRRKGIGREKNRKAVIFVLCPRILLSPIPYE
jgi:hypothetical protein